MKIDWWTLALQTINVAILLLVLQRFLFKPVQAIIDKRQRAVQQLMAEVTTSKQRTEQERAALEQERLALTSGQERALAIAKAQAQKAGSALLEQASQESQRRALTAKTALQRERAEVEVALRMHVAQLAANIARRLLERLPAASWNRHFIESACRHLSTLPTIELDQLKNSVETDAIAFISADTCCADDQEYLTKLLSVTLKHEVHVTFSTDASLLAGVEIRFRHLVISDHWANDILQLTSRIINDEHLTDGT